MYEKLIYINSILIIAVLFLACSESLKQKGEIKYINEIELWRQKRIENLKKEDGWLNLVGLYWLKEGQNIFGSDISNDIVFPRGTCPGVIGKFILKDSVVSVVINKDINVVCNGKKITETILINDVQGLPTILELESLRWFIIKRGVKYGVRLRNLNSELVKKLKNIESFPINSDWKLEAKFTSYNPLKNISVPNVLGSIEVEKSPGALVFTMNGAEYNLDVLGDGDSYFVIFADETSGKETYGGGRFLNVLKTASNEKIFIDFNKAYNPPCAFTKYATCPLPPKQNYLKLSILAGEKNIEHQEN